jgi:hypothetical protein
MVQLPTVVTADEAVVSKPFTNDVVEGIAPGKRSWWAADAGGRGGQAAQRVRARVEGGKGNASGSPT